MSSPDRQSEREHILSDEERDEIAHYGSEDIDHALTFLKENDPEFIDSIRRLANRITGNNSEKKALFIAGAIALGGLMAERLWRSKIDEITGPATNEPPAQ